MAEPRRRKWFEEANESDYALSFLNLNNNPQALLRAVGEGSFDGLVAYTDAGMAVASVVAPSIDVTMPSAESVFACLHKGASRRAQQLVVPEATPLFWDFDLSHGVPNAKEVRSLPYPVFVRPVRSNFSMFAERCNTPEALLDWFARYCAYWMTHIVTDTTSSEAVLRLAFHEQSFFGALVEPLARGMHQATLDGYVFRGEVRSLGVTDSVMLDETVSFDRFVYPSALGTALEKRVVQVAQRLLSSIGFSHGGFNMEFFYSETGDIQIIEVNPRVAMQFEWYYRQINDLNIHRLLLDLSLDRDPELSHTSSIAAEGPVGVCAVLRSAVNGVMRRLPTPEHARRAQEEIPSLYWYSFFRPGASLDVARQDTHSFRYAYAYFTVPDRTLIEPTIERIQELLPFEIEPLE